MSATPPDMNAAGFGGIDGSPKSPEWPSAEEVARALGGARRSGKDWSARCPAHDDDKASLSISTPANGELLVYCHTGCSQEAVIGELKKRDLWRRGAGGPQPSNDNNDGQTDWKVVWPVPANVPEPDFKALFGAEPAAIYRYRDAQGALLGVHLRIAGPSGGKRFLPQTYCEHTNGRTEWRAVGFPKPRFLYGLELLAARPAAPVLVVEGEKAAEAARVLFPEYVVVTWPNGAAAVVHADWAPLASRAVVIWPDADEPGRKAAQEVGRAAEQAGATSVRVVALPGFLPVGWDLADEGPPDLDIGALLTDAPVFDDTLARFVLTGPEVRDQQIPPREFVIEPFLTTSSLSMIFAKRGVGKTWLGLTMAIAIARGERFLSFDVRAPRRVLYVDGEMPLVDLQNRIKLGGGAGAEKFLLLPSELLFRKDRPLNINDPDDQKRVEAMLERLERQSRRPDVLMFDNLSSLGGGIDENDNSALDALLQWLIKLRHMGYAIVLIHHAGKSGDQRGASRREDLLDTSIKLTEPDPKEMIDREGAVFDLEFVKVRGLRPNPDKLRLSLRSDGNGHLQWQFTRSVAPTPEQQTLKAIYMGVDGPGGRGRPHRNQTELSNALGVSKGEISKRLRKLREAGYFALLPRLGGLGITRSGVDHLKEVFELLPQRTGLIVESQQEDEIPF